MKSPENYLTESATLDKGVRVGGTYHKDFTLREEILADNLGENIEIRENFGEEILKEEEDEAISVLKNVVSFRRRLVKLGELNKEELEKVTAKDLFSLTSQDYAIFLRAKTLLDAHVEAALLGKKIEESGKKDDSKKKS